jgi:hypothetical protein
MTYQPPVRDHAFILRDVLKIEQYGNLPGFADASMDTVDADPRGGGPVHRRGAGPAEQRRRQGGLHLEPDFTVKTPTGFKAAYAQLVEAGWPALGRIRPTAARACRTWSTWPSAR